MVLKHSYECNDLNSQYMKYIIPYYTRQRRGIIQSTCQHIVTQVVQNINNSQNIESDQICSTIEVIHNIVKTHPSSIPNNTNMAELSK